MTWSKLTRGISEHAESFSIKRVPKAVVEHTKLIVLDTIGATLAASKPAYPAGRIIGEYVRGQEGKPEASIVGREFKASAGDAALANGTLAYMCDVESYHVKAVLHETAAVLPAAMAVAEKRGASGKALLEAFILGVDLETRLSFAVSPTGMYARGFHPSVAMSTLGSAIAAGKILGISSEGYANALGLAAHQSCGLLSWESDKTEMSRPVGIGVAARSGVLAAELAARGFGGPEVLEGKYTVFGALSGESHPDEILAELGSRWEITNQTIKRYSSCAFTHPGLDAFTKILKDHGLTGDEIDSVNIRFPASGAKLIDRSELKSHNIQYVFSVAAFKGGVGIDDILFDQSDPRIWRLADRVELIHDPSLDAYWPVTMPSIVTVKTRSGAVYEERVDSAKGTPENPVTGDEIREKYRRLAGTVLPQGKVKKVEAAVDGLGDSGVEELAGLLRFKQ